MPIIEYDTAGALKAGWTPTQIAEYLSQQSGFDIGGARKAGYLDDQIVEHLAGPVQAQQPATDKGDFSRGWSVGFGQLAPLAKGAVGLLGATGEQMFGKGGTSTAVKDWGIHGYQEGMQKLQPLQKDTDELTTAWEKAKNGDVGALFDWASYGLGYGSAQLVQAGATAAVGAVIGSAAAGPAGTVAGAAGGLVEGGAVRAAAQRMLTPLIAKEASRLAEAQAVKTLGQGAAADAIAAKTAEFVASEAVKRAAVANVAKSVGQTTGLMGFAGVQEAGSIYPEAEEEAKRKGTELTGADLARVWGSTALATVLEGATDKLGLDALSGKIRLPGKGGLAARTAVGGAIGAAGEAGTEAAQTIVERYGAGKEVFSPEGVKDIINSAGLGAIGGAPVGGIAGALHGPAPTPAAPVVNPTDATLNQAVNQFEAARNSYLDPGVASDAVTSAPSIDEAINTATAIAAGGTQSLSQAIGERAKGAQLAPAMDRQAELTAQANAAPTAFDRQSAAEQAQVALEALRPTPAPASSVVEDSFANEMQATQRLAVLRDEAAQTGQDPSLLSVQPSATSQGRFQIVAAPEPVAQAEAPAAAPAPVSAAEVEQRLSTASSEGLTQAYLRQKDILDRGQVLGSQLSEDLLPGDQQAFKSAYENVANRGGVASPKEAAVLDRLSPNERLYDRVEGKPPALKAAELPTVLPTAQQSAVNEARNEGIARRMGMAEDTNVPGTVEAPALLVPEQRAPARQRTPMAELNADIANTLRENANDASMTQLEQQAAAKQAQQNAAIEAATPPAQQETPAANRVIEAFKKIPALRTAEDKAVVDSALRTYSPGDIRILQSAATAPFNLTSADRVRLGNLKQQNVKASEPRVGGAPVAEQPAATVAPFTTADAKPADVKTLPQQSLAQPGQMSAQSHRFLKSLASVFGKKLVVFESTHPQAVDGYVVNGEPRTIYLNRNSQKSHLVVFGHELMHLLKMNEPGAYEAIRKIVKLRAEAEGRFKNEQGIKGDFEELISDLQGDLFADTGFWADVFREVAGKQGDKAVIRLGTTLMRAVNKFVKALKSVATFDTSAMVENMGEVRSAIQTALATYAKNQKGEAQALYQEEKNAANQEFQQTGVPAERQTGNQSGPTTQAGGGNSVLSNAQVQAPEGEGRQGVKPPTKAEMAARRARQEMGMRFSEQRDEQADNVSSQIKPKGIANEQQAAAPATANGLSGRGSVSGSYELLANSYRANQGTDLQNLPGAITVSGLGPVKFHSFAPAQQAAQRYMESRGLPYQPPRNYVKVDPERAKRIAAAFDAMAHTPEDPEVLQSYNAMVDETLAQYRAILATGLKVEFIDYATQGDPYAISPRLAIADVVANNHMWVFSTRDGFGSSEFDPRDNPLLRETEFEISGQKALANDIFRVVHDYFGHIKEGVGFRADGEENAWRAHASMYSPLARRAMTTETRGQNSWVNYGPFGEANRTAGGAETHFADQKIGLLPEWVSEDGRTDTTFSEKRGEEPGAVLASAKRRNAEDSNLGPRAVGDETVSTRLPTAKSSSEDALRDRLNVGLGVVMRDPKLQQIHADIIRQDPIIGNFNSDDNRIVIERFIESLKDNLLYLWNQVPEDTRARSKTWYVGANNLAEELATQAGIRRRTAAAVIAMLSPQTPWDTNVSQAARVVKIWKSQQESVMGDAQRNWFNGKAEELTKQGKDPAVMLTIRDALEGVKFKDLSSDRILQAWWLRSYDETHHLREYHLITPEGTSAGLMRKNNGAPANMPWGNTANIAKALTVLDAGGDLAAISRGLGKEHKVRSFYNNIIDPNSPDEHTTIDTHAVAAARLEPLSGSSIEVSQAWGGQGSSSVLGQGGLYGEYAEAYRRAAEEVGALPREMQSVTWEAVRGLFPDTFKTKETYDNIREIWDGYRSGAYDINETRELIREYAGGVEEPNWKRQGNADRNSQATGPATNGGKPSALDVRARRPAAGEQEPVTGIRASEKRSPLGFYSALASGIDSIKTNAAPAQGWKDAIKGLVNKGAVKADEVEWSGVNDWLDLQKGKVSRDAIAAYLQDGGVRVEETVLDGSNGEPVRYKGYALPGGENYREVLLTLPSSQPVTVWEVVADGKSLGQYAERDVADALAKRRNGEVKPFASTKPADEKYKSAHWPGVNNILAHLRVDDRTDADGNRVLFVEEIQSDWGQEGKKKGFAAQPNEVRVQAINARLRQLAKADLENTPEWDILTKEKEALTKPGVPVAPFVTKTEGWLNLALKRVITMAAEEGYDKVAFTTGEQNADRYDLSKQIDSVLWERMGGDKYQIIAYGKNQNRLFNEYKRASELPDVVGKELADKIINAPADKKRGSFMGLDLKVGGEGMRAFYDKIVPNAVRSLVKKLGGETGEVRMTADPNQELDAWVPEDGPGDGSKAPVEHLTQPGFAITDAMRDKVQSEGLPLFSRQRIVGDSGRAYTAEQKSLFEHTGRTIEVPTLKERIASLRKDLGKRITQGVVDQFAPIKDLTKDGYLLARLSKGAVGAIEAFMQHGKLSLNGGVYDADRSGGVIDRVFKPLQGEGEDFLWWVAGNRAERLSKEDRENLFTAQDIAAAKSLDNGTTKFDYVLQHGPNAGRTTRDRTLIYRDVLKTFDEFNKNALDMAEQSGLINKESRQYWEHEFYVPFYRVSDDQGGFVGGNIGKGLVRQQAFKQLKGGTDKLNSDLLANTLQNWSHLIDAAAKNRAAKATLEAAANLGVAVEAPQSTIQQMGKAGGKAVWFMDDGVQRHFLVDPDHSDLLEAINGLQFAGLRGPIMDALSGFKHWLTVGVTASPFFKIRNLIRDSMQAIAVSPLSYSPVTNFRQGLAASSRESQTYVSSLASGGLIRFGTMLEGNASERVRQLVRMGVDDSTILNSPDKIQTVLDKFRKGFMAYSEIGNRGEEINRAALYDQLIKSGVSHAEASLMARDLMDFSMQGSWASVRFLTQVVPFMNARLQGLYKLGKGAKEDKARFATVLGAVGAFSLILMAMYHDDDDWKKREDWDRNNNWWFKVGGIAYRIPKPFEIGAMATLAERGVELFANDEMTKQRFFKQVLTLVGDNLSMNPIPQAVKPVLDIYANKDSFSGRPIESMGMERLAPDYRFNSRTSMTARGLGTAGQSVLNATGLSKIGVQSLSPVQIDHLIQGYFSWLGAFAVGGADMLVRPMTNEPTRPAADMFKLASGGMVAKVDSASSRYVSDVYEQAKVLEQAYGTWHSLIKQNKVEEARQYFADNRQEIARYKMVEKVKAGEAKFNEMIRMIERSGLDPDEKRERINLIRAQQDRMARVLVRQ